MATGRIVLVALIFVALTAVPVAARSASSRQEINGYDVKGAPELHAEEGKDDVGASAAKEAHAIMSNPVSKAHVDAAEKYIKEAQLADSPEKAAVAKKAAAQEMASALAYASQDAATKEHVVAPTSGDATEQKEVNTISDVGANTYDAGEKDVALKSTYDIIKGTPEVLHAVRIGEGAAAKAHAIMSNPVSKSHVDAAEKYIKVADSPEKAAAAKKAAAQEIASALAYASHAAAAKEAVSAPTDGDATERKEASTISGVRANTYTAGEKDVARKSTNEMKGAPEVLHAEEGIGEDAASKAHAIMSNPASKAHVDAAEKYIKEAEVADSPEKAAIAKKATAQKMASQGATAIAPTTADSTGGGKSIEQAAPLTTKDDAGYKA